MSPDSKQIKSKDMSVDFMIWLQLVQFIGTLL